MNESLINEEYRETIIYLKRFFLGEIDSISNKQFYEILKAIFKSKYTDMEIDVNEIADIYNIEKKIVDKILLGLMQKDNLSYLDFPFFGNLIKISKYDEEERLSILEKILSSQEENSRVLSEFMPEDLLSDQGISALEDYMFKKIFKHKLQPIINEIETEFNPSFSAKYEYISFNEEYKKKYKSEKQFACLLDFNCYIVKEDEYFLKLYDPNSLEPIFSDKIQLNKNILLRKAVDCFGGDFSYE